MRDLELSQIKPLAVDVDVDVALPGLTPTLTAGDHGSAGISRLRELQERLQSRTPESSASEGDSSAWRKQLVSGAIISIYKKDDNGRYQRYHKDD